MTTSPSATQFPAYGLGDLALVRIVGPGICRESGRFEHILLDLEGRGLRHLVLDLSECPRIDSTFAGTLLRLAERVGDSPLKVSLSGAHGAVRELLDTLCVGDVIGDAPPLPSLTDLAPMQTDDRDMDRQDVMALSLDAHERLAALNEANAARFANLLSVLREQLHSRE